MLMEWNGKNGKEFLCGFSFLSLTDCGMITIMIIVIRSSEVDDDDYKHAHTIENLVSVAMSWRWLMRPIRPRKSPCPSSLRSEQKGMDAGNAVEDPRIWFLIITIREFQPFDEGSGLKMTINFYI